MNTYQLTVIVISLFLACAAAFSQTSPDGASLTDNPVFQRNCAKCHGKTAEGRHFGGPSLVSEKIISATTDELRSVITNGKGRMPKYAKKLTPAEINALVAQIKAHGKE